jgi:fatty acid desaturase
MAQIIQNFFMFFRNIFSMLRGQFQRSLRRVMRQIMMALVASVFLIMGLYFVALGSIVGLSSVLPPWAAYFVVGLVLAVIGLLLMVSNMLSGRA